MVRKINKQKKHYDKHNKTLTVLPVFGEKKYQCPQGHNFDIDFTKKHPPMRPVKVKNGLIAIPISMNIPCPICKTEVTIPVPVKKEEKKFYLFGDEAYRGDDGKSKVFICNYSMVGVNAKRIIEAEDKILEFKLKHFPDLNPWEWKIHLKEMISTTHRKNHLAFKNLEFREIRIFLEELYSLIKSMIENQDISIFTSTIINEFSKGIDKKRHQKKEKELKELTYELSFFHLTDQLTQHGINPCFVFDSERSSKELKTVQQWAENIFYSGEYSMACAFFTKGIDVKKPIFVRPGCRPFLEIADLVCYTIARFLNNHLSENEKEEELCHPKKLGNIQYILGHQNKNGFFYGKVSSFEDFLNGYNNFKS